MKKSTIIIALMFSIFICACENKKNEAELEDPNIKINKDAPARLQRLHEDEYNFVQEKKICVVLGYGYESEESKKTISDKIDKNYGLSNSDKDALVSLFFYPDDFKSHGPTRISQLTENIEGLNLGGLIIYGAPEGMNIPLAAIQDKKIETDINYPVFSFFPQYESPATESDVSFVVEYVIESNNMDAETATEIPDFDHDELILSAIGKIVSTQGNVPDTGKDLKAYVADIVKQKEIHFYRDAETGIQSSNHFIFR